MIRLSPVALVHSRRRPQDLLDVVASAITTVRYELVILKLRETVGLLSETFDESKFVFDLFLLEFSLRD